MKPKRSTKQAIKKAIVEILQRATKPHDTDDLCFKLRQLGFLNLNFIDVFHWANELAEEGVLEASIRREVNTIYICFSIKKDKVNETRNH